MTSMLLTGAGPCRAAAPAFSPSSISWLGWFDETSGYDKSDGMGGYTPVTANNDLCIRWRDKSGNNKHLANAAGATYKTGSPSYLLFDGATNFLDATINRAQPSTVIFVASHDSSQTGTGTFFDSDNVNNQRVFADTGSSFLWPTMFSGSAFSGNSPEDEFIVAACLFNGASSKLYENAKTPSTGNPGTGTDNGFHLGRNNEGTNYFKGSAIALWIYDGALDNTSIGNMLDYCADRYGISIGA